MGVGSGVGVTRVGALTKILLVKTIREMPERHPGLRRAGNW